MNYRYTAPLKATFPPPRDININMMPFILDEPDSLPEEYLHYWDLIEMCSSGSLARYIKEEEREYQDQDAKERHVVYLTIHESEVKEGESQRRGGLHTECSGLIRNPCTREVMRVGWGIGEHSEDYFDGGS